jgi:hypothetical protein
MIIRPATMSRRGFLRSVLGITTAIVLPLPPPEPLPMLDIKFEAFKFPRIMGVRYFVVDDFRAAPPGCTVVGQTAKYLMEYSSVVLPTGGLPNGMQT